MKDMLGGIYTTFDKRLNIAMLSKIGNWIVGFAAKVSMISGSVILALLALFTTANVILRAFGVMTYGFYEIILLMIVALVLSGAAYTEKTNGQDAGNTAHYWTVIRAQLYLHFHVAPHITHVFAL